MSWSEIDKITEYKKRHFAGENHPFDDVEWEVRKCGQGEEEEKVFKWQEILYNKKPEKTKKKRKVFYNVECPKHWSQLACNTAVAKYLRKGDIPEWAGTNHVPPILGGSETSIKQLIHRVAKFMSENNHILDTKEEKENLYMDLCWLLLHQHIGFNTPIWINAGLYTVYGIEGSNRFRWWFDPHEDRIVKLEREQVHPGGAACYLTAIEDTLHGPSGMYDYIIAESRVFAMGAGNGANISKIRGKGEPISGGGISEGIIQFLKIPDSSAAYIKSGGVSRRAARMLVCDIDHPDIEEFIVWKGQEEDKAQMMANGYLEKIKSKLAEEGKELTPEEESSIWYELIDWRGDIYSTVSGQQSNNSVMLTDEFMNAVKEDKDWKLKWRTNPSKGKTVKARKLWHDICEQAWKCADPGIMFYDNINNWNTVPKTGPIVTSNPCSEVFQPNYTSCNLCTLNLVKFDKKWIDMRYASKIVIMCLETVAYWCSSPTDLHADMTHRIRPLGANIGNIGSYLMRNGLAYDSDEARERIAEITSFFNASCWEASGEIAEKIGAYPDYVEEDHYKIIKQHLENTEKLISSQMRDTTIEMYRTMIERKVPFRNNAVTCMVPTGTIGLVMDYDTLGIEPMFCIVARKELAGGGFEIITNNAIVSSLENLGYENAEELGKKILEKNTAVGIVKDEHLPIFDGAASCSKGRSISYMGHIDMLAAIQPHISMAISKTINMPENTTVEEVADLYMYSWEKNLKSVAIYRDMCKMSQPLNKTYEIEENTDDEGIDEAMIMKELSEVLNGKQ